MRIIGHGRKKPFAVKLVDVPGMKGITNDEKVLNYELHICACGLSKHKPFCDGSHSHVAAEDDAKLFSYTEENKPEEVNVKRKDGSDVRVIDRYE